MDRFTLVTNLFLILWLLSTGLSLYENAKNKDKISFQVRFLNGAAVNA
jgi:hypothetical protein